MLPVNDYIDHFISMWEKSSTDFPTFPKKYSVAEQEQREINFLKFQEKTESLRSRKKIRSLKSGDPGKSFFPIFKAFLEDVFDFRKEHLEIILSEQFRGVSKDFFYRARAFGPELSPENIYQGLRNVWIMNGIQLMMELPVEITPSMFGYSMIYPYSDNYLDDPSVTGREKAQFSERFNRRLHGENTEPHNHTELQLFRLVEMFEEQYPRNEYPEVYESLYAIQQGQTNSLRLIRSNGLEQNEIKRICFEKGGASVLADGYLVAGKLTRSRERALFGYGVYLQLLDDIQDVREDSEAHTRTLFTCTDRLNLDNYVNRTINFGRSAMEELRCFKVESNHFLQLMNRSIETMIVESVGLNPHHFSEEWLGRMEQHSPLRFDFIRKKRTQSKSQRFALFQKYFDQQPEAVGF